MVEARYCQAQEDAEYLLKRQGLYAQWGFYKNMYQYLQMTIDDAIATESAIIRA